MSQKTNLLKKFGYKQELTRAFGIWSLTAYGLNYMIPIAPAIIFGFVLQTSGGTVALPYLFALCGTLFTAFGYAYFIKRYPLAGSVYSYVSKSIGTQIGFLAGWAILLDYILIPTVTSMSAASFLHDLIPILPYEPTLIVFIAFTGLLNLLGANPLAKIGLSMLILGEIVIFVGFIVWAYAVQVKHIGVGHLFSIEPFHFKSFASLTAATSIAMLSYLGFDAITTLAEESKFPTRDIPKAIFLSLFIGSFTMFLTGYLGTLVIPDWHQYIGDSNWINATLFFVSKRAGGEGLVLFYTIGFVIAMGVFNVVATTGASRILFSISRDKIIPLKFLSYVNKSTHVPIYGIILIVIIQILIGSVCRIDTITEVVNFGALFGFVMLNIAFLVHMLRFDITDNFNKLKLAIPIAGTVINLWILSHLGKVALIVGVFWLIGGIVLFSVKKAKIHGIP